MSGAHDAACTLSLCCAYTLALPPHKPMSRRTMPASIWPLPDFVAGGSQA